MTSEEMGIKFIKLTLKERDVLRFVCGGFQNREIAQRLFCSKQTIDVHLNNIYLKMGLKDEGMKSSGKNEGLRHRVQAAMLAVKWGQVNLEDIEFATPTTGCA